MKMSMREKDRERGEMLIEILYEAVCISHSTNILGKGMNPIILSPARGKY